MARKVMMGHKEAKAQAGYPSGIRSHSSKRRDCKTCKALAFRSCVSLRTGEPMKNLHRGR